MAGAQALNTAWVMDQFIRSKTEQHCISNVALKNSSFARHGLCIFWHYLIAASVTTAHGGLYVVVTTAIVFFFYF